MAEDRRDETTDREEECKRPAPPPAGPHERPELTDEDKTPGTGSLPETREGESDAGVG